MSVAVGVLQVGGQAGGRANGSRAAPRAAAGQDPPVPCWFPGGERCPADLRGRARGWRGRHLQDGRGDHVGGRDRGDQPAPVAAGHDVGGPGGACHRGPGRAHRGVLGQRPDGELLVGPEHRVLRATTSPPTPRRSTLSAPGSRPSTTAADATAPSARSPRQPSSTGSPPRSTRSTRPLHRCPPNRVNPSGCDVDAACAR